MKKVKNLKKRIKYVLSILIPIFFVNFLVFTLAWTNPTQTPPDANPPFPLAVGLTEQFKDAALGVGGIVEVLGIHLKPGAQTQPECNESTRGMMWLDKGGSEEASNLVFCRKVLEGEYAWEVVELGLKWPDGEGYIYNEGDYEDMWVEGFFGGGDQWKDTDHLFLEHYSSPGDHVTWVTGEKIDLAGISHVKADIDGVTRTLDVSALNGFYYIRIHLLSGGVAGDFLSIVASTSKDGDQSENDAIESEFHGLSANIYKVWLE